MFENRFYIIYSFVYFYAFVKNEAFEDSNNQIYIIGNSETSNLRAPSNTRLIERRLVTRQPSRKQEIDEYQIMYDTFGKPIMQQTTTTEIVGTNIGETLRFSGDGGSEEFLNLNEPVGETGVVTVLNQNIIDDDLFVDEVNARRQRENFI